MIIRFRPHHFLCTLGFQGKGYSPAFVANYQMIVDTLRQSEGDNILIHVVEKTDSICAPCPNKRDERCATQAKIDALDKAHAAILNIKVGDILSWGEAKKRIARQMTLEKFHTACAICPWKRLGVCEKALTELKQTFA